MLRLQRGTELIIISMQELDPGWWRGALPDGRVGVFPANYVQQL
jgi:drebrin-like protein